MKWRKAFECTNTYFLSACPSFCRGKKFPNTSCPNQLLLQELLKSNAQTSGDKKEGQKEEIVTEVRGFNIQDDVRHAGVRNGGGAGSCHHQLKDSARRHLQKSVSPPLQRFMSGSISFLVLSLKRPLVIHRGMTNSQVWQVGQTIWIQDPTGTVDKPVCPPLQRFLARFIQIDSVHFPPALMTWISFRVAIFNLRWFRPAGGFWVIWRMHTICWIVQTLHFRVQFWFLPQIPKSWITEDVKNASHNIGCFGDSRPIQMENEVVWTLCEKYGPIQICTKVVWIWIDCLRNLFSKKSFTARPAFDCATPKENGATKDPILQYLHR